jgi:MFS family permease
VYITIMGSIKDDEKSASLTAADNGEILDAGKAEGRTAPDANHINIDPKAETKLLAKLDLYFVPIIMLVYLSCFLDRSNIGNVKVAGMPKDIHATNEQFSTAVSIFYATYVVSETPWAVLLKKLTPRLLLTGLAVIWSLVTIFSGFIHNIGGLYATRLILGACEGGLFPGLNLYLTMVYRREEQAKRVSYLFVCTAISGAFGGLLAYAILHMDGVSGVAGWRYAICFRMCIELS